MSTNRLLPSQHGKLWVVACEDCVESTQYCCYPLAPQKQLPLQFMCIPVFFCGFSKITNSAGSRFPFSMREERKALIPFILPNLSPMVSGKKEKPPVAHFVLCSYTSTYMCLCAYMHTSMNVIVHARVCVITSSRCHTTLMDYVSLTQ